MTSGGGADPTGASSSGNGSAHGSDARARVRHARRVVVKIGSSSLTGRDGRLDTGCLDALVEAVAARRADGVEVVLVSSGAIAAGIGPLRLDRRPRDIATLQAAASVGQLLLVERYAAAFARHGLLVGQVLLTAEDVIRRANYRNARRTLNRLIALGVVPVVNENDTVTTEEIRFGDNDRLAALVAHLVAAEALVLLSDVDAVYDDDPRRPGARRIGEIRTSADLTGVRAVGSRSGVGSGGMATKLAAATTATGDGVTVLVAAASDAAAALGGGDVGTVFHATGPRRPSRLQWLAHASSPVGRLLLDEGAVAAVTTRGASLLAAGITGVVGEFSAGDPVDLLDPVGAAVARGIVAYDADELPELLGRSTHELPPQHRREVIHRDDLVVLGHGLSARRPSRRGDLSHPSD